MSVHKSHSDNRTDDMKRKERNARLLAKLDNIEKKAAFLQAKTDRIRSLKSIYKNNFHKKQYDHNPTAEIYFDSNRIFGNEKGAYKYFEDNRLPLNLEQDYLYKHHQQSYIVKNITLDEAIEEIARRYILIPKNSKNANSNKNEKFYNTDTSQNNDQHRNRKLQIDEVLNAKDSQNDSENIYKLKHEKKIRNQKESREKLLNESQKDIIERNDYNENINAVEIERYDDVSDHHSILKNNEMPIEKVEINERKMIDSENDYLDKSNLDDDYKTVFKKNIVEKDFENQNDLKHEDFISDKEYQIEEKDENVLEFIPEHEREEIDETEIQRVNTEGKIINNYESEDTENAEEYKIIEQDKNVYEPNFVSHNNVYQDTYNGVNQNHEIADANNASYYDTNQTEDQNYYNTNKAEDERLYQSHDLQINQIPEQVHQSEQYSNYPQNTTASEENYEENVQNEYDANNINYEYEPQNYTDMDEKTYQDIDHEQMQNSTINNIDQNAELEYTMPQQSAYEGEYENNIYENNVPLAENSNEIQHDVPSSQYAIENNAYYDNNYEQPDYSQAETNAYNTQYQEYAQNGEYVGENAYYEQQNVVTEQDYVEHNNNDQVTNDTYEGNYEQNAENFVQDQQEEIHYNQDNNPNYEQQPTENFIQQSHHQQDVYYDQNDSQNYEQYQGINYENNVVPQQSEMNQQYYQEEYKQENGFNNSNSEENNYYNTNVADDANTYATDNQNNLQDTQYEHVDDSYNRNENMNSEDVSHKPLKVFDSDLEQTSNRDLSAQDSDFDFPTNNS